MVRFVVCFTHVLLGLLSQHFYKGVQYQLIPWQLHVQALVHVSHGHLPILIPFLSACSLQLLLSLATCSAVRNEIL